MAANRWGTILGWIALAFGLAPAAAVAAPGAATTGWVTNGPVHAMATDDAGRTYIGGSFTYVGPRLGSAIALTASGDQPAAGFPDVNGQVLAIADDGAGGWFLGGTFTAVGGIARNRLAHIRADRTLDPAWDPGADNTVRTLVRAGAALYAGGDFISAGGRPGTRVVKLATTGTGAGDPAFSLSSGPVRALALSGSGLYVGTTTTLVKADAATGVVDATWNPAPSTGVNALATGPDGLYVGGAFTTIGGQSRNGLAKLSLTGTGAADPAWNPDVSDGPGVQALALAGDDLYVGGGFAHVGGQAHYGAAKVASSGTGAVSAWNPGVGPVAAIAVTSAGVYLGGEVYAPAANARYLVRVAPDGTAAADHWTPNPNAAVTALAAAGDDVLAGGSFTSAGAGMRSRAGLSRLLPDGRLDTTFDPPSQPGSEVKALALDGGTLYVAGSLGLDGGPPVGLRRFSTATGALDPAWTPTTDVAAEPQALALSGDSVFAGTGLSSDALLKFSTSGSGARDTTWDPDADGHVYALAASGTDLYVAGSFGVLGNGIDGVYRDVVKLSTTGTGALDAAWDPQTFAVFTMALVGDDLYLGGAFPPIGGAHNARLAKVSASGTGAVDTAWEPQPDDDVTALAVSGGDLYVGGTFTRLGVASHARIAKVPLNGTGAPDPAFTFSASDEVDAITASPDRLVIGGAFTSTGSLSTQGVALFDFSAPSVDLSVPADGGRYRIGQDVRAAYGCTDPGGTDTIASCDGTVPAGAAIDTSTPGAHSFTVDTADTSGNAATKTVSYWVDDTVPTIAFGALPGGATYTIGERATITYSCDDAAGAQDIATCAGPIPSGGLLDTSTAGAFTFSVTATDRVGNTATARVSYSVWPPNLKPKPTPTPTPKLTLSALKLSPSAFRAEPRGAATGKPTAAARKLKRGTRVQFTLSAAARTTFTVIRPKKGKVKAKTLGTFTVAGTAKINRFILRGRIAGKTLKPGKYQLRAQAKDTKGTKSAIVVTSFTIKR
ncbi:MAG TPA: hypothetical protein VI318_24415 [Baekduia sp.]